MRRVTHTLLSHLIASCALVAIASGCRTSPQTEPETPGDDGPTDPVPVDSACALQEPEILREEGDAILLRWELPQQAILSRQVRPASDALARYRIAIIEDGGALKNPIADPEDWLNDSTREVWEREKHNEAMAASGEAGKIRPMQCLEAMFFAYQAERFDALDRPTEFIVAVVSKEIDGAITRRAYFGAGDEMFPPKEVYPFDAAIADVERGWTFEIALHNHTPREREGKHALGVPAPSTNDVQLARALATHHGLQTTLVTNGFYTVEIPSAALAHYRGPVARPPE